MGCCMAMYKLSTPLTKWRLGCALGARVFRTTAIFSQLCMPVPLNSSTPSRTEETCQHRLKRGPRASPFRGPTFDSLIGGDAAKTLQPTLQILRRWIGPSQVARQVFIIDPNRPSRVLSE